MGTRFTDTARTPAATSKIPIELADGSKGYCTPITLGQGKACFSANKDGTNQTGVADGATVLVTATTEAFDSGGYYDAANSKWTPPAGPVRLSARVNCTGVKASGGVQAIIYKNGSAFKTGSYFALSTSNSFVSCIDNANGTDYYELYMYADATTTVTIVGNTSGTYFEGEQL